MNASCQVSRRGCLCVRCVEGRANPSDEVVEGFPALGVRREPRPGRDSQDYVGSEDLQPGACAAVQCSHAGSPHHAIGGVGVPERSSAASRPAAGWAADHRFHVSARAARTNDSARVDLLERAHPGQDQVVDLEPRCFQVAPRHDQTRGTSDWGLRTGRCAHIQGPPRRPGSGGPGVTGRAAPGDTYRCPCSPCCRRAPTSAFVRVRPQPHPVIANRVRGARKGSRYSSSPLRQRDKM
jgi:hypothetical protein